MSMMKLEYPIKARLLAALVSAGAIAVSSAESGKSIASGELWPDDKGIHINAHGGGILFHQGVYYWFGEHKVAGGAGNTAQVGVGVYSSRDLYQWKNEGIALSVDDDPKSDIAKGCILERPKVIHNAKTGKFVMWFHLELRGQGYGAARSGVAIADKVTGPYRFLGSFRPNAGVWPSNVSDEMKKPLAPEELDRLSKVAMPGDFVPEFAKDWVFRRDFNGGQMARDMTLFADDDGAAYHIYASEENSTLQISRLSDDYLKPAGKYIRIFPLAFNEAPAVFKCRGKYYLFSSGCTGWAPNAARLAVADSIWGPWQALGNPCVGPADRIGKAFDSQSTFVLPVKGRKDAFIFMADRWRPENAIDGRYVWLPVRFGNEGKPFIEWMDRWDMDVFTRP